MQLKRQGGSLTYRYASVLHLQVHFAVLYFSVILSNNYSRKKVICCVAKIKRVVSMTLDFMIVIMPLPN